MLRAFRVGLLVVAASGTAVRADTILEVEANGTAVNNTLATAQALPLANFTTPVPMMVFNPPGHPTATILGRGGSSDVDIYSFNAGTGAALFDVDNNPSAGQVGLALFNAGGTLIGFSDASNPADAGSANGNADPFLGTFLLPSPGTYYLAVFNELNILPVSRFTGTPSQLFRPDGAQGGIRIDNADPGTFSMTGPQPTDSLGYTVHVSLQSPADAAVPEPAGLTLAVVGVFGLGGCLARRRGAKVQPA
jgi:hypothetical protein